MSIRLVIVMFLALFIYGCSSETTKESSESASTEGAGATVEERSAATSGDAGAATTYGAPSPDVGSSAMQSSEGAASSIVGGPGSSAEERVIYFEYDSSEVLPQYRPVVEAHARYLAANQGTVITLDGHADERGSREYNLALGERRAYSVKSQMTLLGAGDNQINIVSHGEERPSVDGHDENAWSKNRRVEISY